MNKLKTGELNIGGHAPAVKPAGDKSGLINTAKENFARNQEADSKKPPPTPVEEKKNESDLQVSDKNRIFFLHLYMAFKLYSNL